MAVERKLSLDIDVDKSNLTKKLADATKIGEQFTKGFASNMNKVDKAIKEAETTVHKYSDAVLDVQKVIDRLSKTSFIQNKPNEALRAASDMRRTVEKEMHKMGAFSIDIDTDINTDQLKEINSLYDTLASVEKRASKIVGDAAKEQANVQKQAQKQQDTILKEKIDAQKAAQAEFERIGKATIRQQQKEADEQARINKAAMDESKKVAKAIQKEKDEQTKAVERAAKEQTKAQQARIKDLNKTSNLIRKSMAQSTFNQVVDFDVRQSSINKIMRTLGGVGSTLSSSLATGAKVGSAAAYTTISSFVSTSSRLMTQLTNASGNIWSGAAKGLESTNSIAQKTGSGILNAFTRTNNAGTNLTRTVMTLTAGFVSLRSATNLLKGSIDRLDTIDQATKSLTNLMGSYEGARTVVDDTVTALEGTPLAIDDTIQGVKRLIATGMKATKVNKTIQAINDAAFGVGKGQESVGYILNAFAQMQASAQVYLQDLNQLSDQGVPALRILANQMGKTTTETKEMISDGLVPSAEAIDMLIDGITNGTDGINGMTAALGGMAKTAGDSISGVASNMNIQLRSLGVDLIKPFKDNVINAFQSTIDIMKLFRKNVLQSESVQNRLNAASDKAYSIVDKLLLRIQQGIETNEKFSFSIDGVTRALAGLGTAAAVISLAPMFGNISASALSGATGLSALLQTVESSNKPFSLLTDLSSSLSNNLTKASNAGKKFKLADFGKMLTSTNAKNELNIQQLADEAANVEYEKQKALDSVQERIQHFRSRGIDLSSDYELDRMQKTASKYDSLLLGIRKSTNKQESFMRTKDIFGGMLSKVSSGLSSTIGMAASGIATLIGGSLTIATGMISTFGQTAVTVLAATTRMIVSAVSASVTAGFVAILGGGLLAGLGYIDGLFGDQIRKLVDKVTIEGPKVITKLTESISKQLPGLIKTGTDLLMYILNGVNMVLPTLLDSIGSIAIQLANGFVDASPEIITSLLSIVNKLAGFVASYGPQLISSGADLLMNIGNGIVQALPEFIGHVGTFLTDTLRTIDSKVPAFFSMGINLLDALAQGLIDNVPSVISALTDTIGSIATNFAANKDAIVNSVNSVITMIRQTLEDNGPALMTSVGTIIFTIVDGLTALAPNLIGGFADLIIIVADWIGNNGDLIVNSILDLVIAAGFGIIEHGPRLIESVYTMLDKMVNAIIENKEKFALAGLVIGAALIASIGAAVEGLGMVLSSILDPIFTWIGEMLDDLAARIRDMWDNSGLGKIVNEVGGWFSSGNGGGRSFYSQPSSEPTGASTMRSNLMSDILSMSNVTPLKNETGVSAAKSISTNTINRDVTGINNIQGRGGRVLVHTELVGDKIYTYVSERTAEENDANMLLV